jgi:2-C-methyl-D-erythritol 2,4-cyclodiphosphate synthase
VGKIPKIISYREAIIENLSKILAIDSNKISCKATTTDGLGFEGNLEGVSCHCISLIE